MMIDKKTPEEKLNKLDRAKQNLKKINRSGKDKLKKLSESEKLKKAKDQLNKLNDFEQVKKAKEQLNKINDSKQVKKAKSYISEVQEYLNDTEEHLYDEDVNFVDTLHSQANAKVTSNSVRLFQVIVIFFIGVITWAYFAEIDELARGEGKVIPTDKIQTIQSLDGGIISDILIAEGEIIKKDQPLMKIDTTRFQASLQENQQTYDHLRITQARLEVESVINLSLPLPVINYPKNISEDARPFAKNDYRLFESRIKELKSSINIFRVQLKQKQQELIELRSKRQQLKRSKEFVLEELETMEKLAKRGSKSKVDLLRIKKEHNTISGELQATVLAIPRLKFAIEEARSRVNDKLNAFKSEVSNELQKINTEIKKYQSKIVSEQDKLDKTILISPVNGIVKQINMNTIGGVVRSGQDLIEIVPQSEILLVEAKIDPKDIAFINPKQKAIVKITAYDFSIYGGLDGSIVEISADSIIDKEDKNQKSYYKVVIKTNKNFLEKNGEKLPIIPGMITSVDIITGKKTILDFILKPILKTKQNALHER